MRLRLRPYKRNLKASEQGWRCHACRELLPALFHIDHIVPRCEGGSDAWPNLCALCPPCHSKKTEREVERYWDRKRENTSGKSKYFEIGSTYFIDPAKPPLPPSCANFFKIKK